MKQNDELSALDLVRIMGIIARLEWTSNNPDKHGFDGAEMIADVPENDATDLMEILDMRAEHGLLAAMGNGGVDGDPYQVELHGCTIDGEPLAWILRLNTQADY